MVNTHLFWDPKLPHVKVLQIHYCLEKLNQFLMAKGLNTHTPGFLVGDFNSLPDSDVYQYISFEIPTNSVSYLSTGFINKRRLRLLDLDHLPPVTHPFKLYSAYALVHEPDSNVTGHFRGCLDYIWYTTDTNVLKLLLPPSYNHYKNQVALPNLQEPSDHTSLLANFEIKRN